MTVRMPRDDVERRVEASSGFEEIVPIRVDEEEFRPVSAEGHCSRVPGEGGDWRRFLDLVVAER